MNELIEQFMNHYLPREEVAWRLPIQITISNFWPELLAARKEQSTSLPLTDQSGNPFWFVASKSIISQCNSIIKLAFQEELFHTLSDDLAEESLIDEAVWSSVIEGAFTSKQRASKMIRQKLSPKNKSEQMILNNYDALKYVLDHLEEPITRQTLIDLAHIVTKDPSEEPVEDFRSEQVYIVGKGKIVYTPPAAELVADQMDQLLSFISGTEFHPLLKACIAHFFFVYIHPFSDGNGRTARALTYMMLLKHGYDIFRYFSISNIIAQERNRYYRSIYQVEQAENGPADMTYFIDFYTAMIERSLHQMEHTLSHHLLAQKTAAKLEQISDVNERRIQGAKWLLEGDHENITVDQWKKKYGTSTETARQDLLWLSNAGVLERTMEGKKAVFHILRNTAS